MCISDSLVAGIINYKYIQGRACFFMLLLLRSLACFYLVVVYVRVMLFF